MIGGTGKVAASHTGPFKSGGAKKGTSEISLVQIGLAEIAGL